MKTAAIFLHPSTSQNPKAPAFYGTVFFPASLVMELYNALQSGQYDPKDTDQQTGEPRFALKASLWREDGSKGYVMSGNLESLSEAAAYQASKAQQQPPAGGGWGASPVQAAPQGPPPGYGQPAQAPGYGQAPPPGYAPQQAPAPMPAQQQWATPQPAPQPPAQGGWGQPVPDGWG